MLLYTKTFKAFESLGLRYAVVTIENLKTAIFVHSILWMRKRELIIIFYAFLVFTDTQDIFGTKSQEKTSPLP